MSQIIKLKMRCEKRNDSKRKKGKSFQEEMARMSMEMRKMNSERKLQEIKEASKAEEEAIYLMIYGKSALKALTESTIIFSASSV